MPQLKVANSDDLRRLIHRARRHVNQNHNLTNVVLRNLDPNGMHVLQPLMLHEYTRETAVRCRALLRLKGSKPNEPTTFVIDVLLSDFNDLVNAREVMPCDD